VSWEVEDYQVFRQAVSFTATNPPFPGVPVTSAQIQLPKAVPANQVFRIERLGVMVTEGTRPGVEMLVQVYDQWPIETTSCPCDQTVLTGYGVDGYFDVADNSGPITVQQGDLLTVVFTAQSSYTVGGQLLGGAQAVVRAQYQILGGGASAAPTPVAGATPAPAISPSL
jgi:hypothetical protein